MAEVAVVIPTKDRHALLDEAIASATAQTAAAKEIIVVDDGSAAAVDEHRLRARFDSRVRVLRNASSLGLAYARNLGVEACTSTHVIHLDDDDLLVPEAIATCLATLRTVPRADVLVFGVEGFGPNAAHFNRVQPAGVEQVLREAGGEEVMPDVILFGESLFAALLRTVPSAFQRVMTTTAMWHRVSTVRRYVYSLAAGTTDEEAAKRVISGPLRDSEWARYAAATCRMCLIKTPLYLARCAGQGYSSLPANRQAHAAQGLSILRNMAIGSNSIPELVPWRREISEALGRTCFDLAYQFQQSGDDGLAWQHLRQAAKQGIEIRQLRLAARLLWPLRRGRK